MVDPETCSALLLKSRFFSGVLAEMGNDDRQTFARAFVAVSYQAGQHIFSRGDPGDSLLLVSDGRIRLSVITDDGRELSIRHAVKGDVIGEIAALDGKSRTTDAFAIHATKALMLSRKDFVAAMVHIPGLSQQVIALLCGRLRETTDQMEAIALHPIEARLARFLLVALQGRQAEGGKRVALDLGFSQSELAQLLGASRPKVNIALGMLEKLGAVKRTSDRLFCDPILLARMANLADDA